MKHNRINSTNISLYFQEGSDSKTIKTMRKNKNHRWSFLMITCFLMMLLNANLSWGQVLSNNDFSFAGTLTTNGWVAHSGAGTNAISTTTGLTYTGLPGSGIGNAALVNNLAGEDDNITFTNQNTDGQSIYFSCMVKVTEPAASKTGDVFLHIGTPGGVAFTAFAARVFAKVTAGVVNFGLSNTSTATYGTTPFAINTTYLLIVKYTISVAGNDPTSLWVVTSGVPASEVAAGVAEVTNTTTAGQNAINTVALRQGSATTSVQTVVDGIVVGNTWNDVSPGLDEATLSNISPQPSGAILVGANNVVLAGFKVSSVLSKNFTNVTVTGGGSATSSDINTIRIFRDNNGDGFINGADASVSGAGVPFASPIVFTITGETGVTSARTYLIVANVDVAADASRNVSVSVAPGAFVTTAASNVGNATGNLREIDPASTPLITLSGALTPFTTAAGTPSTQQSYTVEGINLSANVDITPPAEFKIRIDANAFSSSPISLTPAQVIAPGKTIDVVYDPAAAGSHSGNITHTSTGAAQKDKAVTGSSTATQPTTQPAVTFGAVTSHSMVINFSGGNGASVVVVVSDINAVSYIPTDGIASAGVSSLYFSLSSPNGNKIVYDGSIGTGTVTVTGLDQLTTYHVAAYGYNGSGVTSNYLTTSPGINNTITLAKVVVPVPMASQGLLTYTENFSDILNWGNDFNFGIGTNPWGGVGVNGAGVIPDGVRTTVSTATFTTATSSGGVQRGGASGSTNPVGSIVQLATGSADNTATNAIEVFLDFTGVGAGTLSYNWATVINSTGDRNSSLRVFTSIDGIVYTPLPTADVLNKSNGAIVTGSVTTVALPISFTNSATARIRFYITNGTGGSFGSRSKIAIDNLVITATTPPTQLVVTTISPATPTQNAGFSVTVEAHDGSNILQKVLTNTNVTLSYLSGTGTFGGTLTGTILAGTNNVVISGVTYSVAESGVSLTATRTAGDVLSAGNSATFTVIIPIPAITVTGTLLPFLTGVGTQSASQPYTVKGDYLNADILITPPAQFEIRTGANAFSASAITLVQSPIGTVSSTIIDVRYAPSSAGPHSGNISHTSLNAVTQNEAVSGSTSAPEPTISSAVTFGCSSNNSIIVNFTGGNGSSRIVVASASPVTFIPTDGTPSGGVVSNDFSVASDQGGGNKIVYNASGSTVTISGLSASTTYFIRVYEYNGTGSISEYLTSSFGSGSKPTLGPISYSTTGSNYLQDFDGLPSVVPVPAYSFSGAGPFLVSACPISATNASGWQFGKASGTAPNVLFTIDNGGGGSGSVYSFGTTANTDRALGALASSGLTASLGTVIVNNTPDILRTITISYTGEQWRNGGSGAANVLTFSYSLNGTDIFTGTYTPVASLNFSSPKIGAVAGALDGDAALNRTVVTSTFSLNANWSSGQKLIIKWADNNDAGNDDGLAIDDFSFSATVPVAPTVQDHDIFFPVVSTISLTAKWLNGNGSAHLVKMRDVFVDPPISNPVDGTDYPAVALWANGGEQVVYNGTVDSVQVTGLTPGTLYEFMAFGYNGSALSSKYVTTAVSGNPEIIFTEFPTAPTKLAILSVNGGANPTVNQSFSVVVQSQDIANNAQNVNIATNVELSVTNGFGNLTATISGTILAGQNSVTITGVILDLAENNVELTATRTAGFTPLDPGVSALFNVLDVATKLSFFTVPANGIANVALGTIVVRAVRPDNTVDANYSGNITLAVNTGPGTISGLLTQPTVSGEATFTNLINNIKLSTNGAYTLSATSIPVLTPAISSTINITATPVMTELVVPKFMGSKTTATTNTNRTPFVVCVKIDNLVPNTFYDLRVGLGIFGSDVGFYGAGNHWNVSAFNANNIVNAFQTDGTGSSGPYWIYFQPTENSTRFSAGQVHNVRIGYVIHGAGSTPSAPDFTGTKQITALDIAPSAITPTLGDDGAFLKGTFASCAAGKYVLIYDNVGGTGDPIFAYQSRQTIPSDATISNYSNLPPSIDSIYVQGGGTVVGDWPAVIPIGANNPNGVRRIEARNADNTILGSETAALGIWPGGANTTNNTRRSVTSLIPSDAPISIHVSNLNILTGCSGNAVIITGSHFTGATNVSFNGTSATFSVFSDTEIHTTVPAGATTGIVTVTSSTGCVGSGPSIIVTSCGVTLNAKVLLECFYQGQIAGQPEMNQLLYNYDQTLGGGAAGVPVGVSDTVLVSACDETPLSGHPVIDSQKGLLYKNGDVTVTFGPAVTAGTSYYIKVNHRSYVETWSAVSVPFTTTTSYSFLSAQSQAFGSNEALTFDALYAAMLCGDLNQDGAVDGSDFLEYDGPNQAGAGGYELSDMNGDGAVDGSDFLCYDPNNQNGVGSAVPNP